jgi:hypothetical protein
MSRNIARRRLLRTITPMADLWCDVVERGKVIDLEFMALSPRERVDRCRRFHEPERAG